MRNLIFLAVLALTPFSMAAEMLAKPTPPAFEDCKPITSTSTQAEKEENLRCSQKNASLLSAYSEQVARYNASLPPEQTIQGQQKLAADQQKGALASAMTAYQQSMSAAAQANASADSNRRMSTRFYILAATVTFGASAFIPLAIYYGMESRKDANAKDQFYRSANEACKMILQLSAGGAGGCTPNTTASTGSNYQNEKLFDSSGKCLGSKAECGEFAKLSPQGLNLKDLQKGINAFASGKTPYKINADGSVTTAEGKKITANSIASEKGMVEAGMSPADAKAFMAKIKNKEAEDQARGGKFDTINVMSTPNLGSYVDNSVSSTNKTTEITINGDASTDGKFLPAALSKRRVAAEGLAKDFNGELIGVAGDDIFKMVNRRYKLKASQDVFIAP